MPEKKTVKNRFHLDLYVADRTAPVEEIVATVDARWPSWSVSAPEGNEFCVA